MGKRRKLDQDTKADIIKKFGTCNIGQLAKHFERSPSTIRRVLKQDIVKRVKAKPQFQRHAGELALTLRWIMPNSGLLHSSLVHFKQIYPEFASIRDWQEITQKEVDAGILEKMQLLADSQDFNVSSECPVCQSIKKQL